MVVLDVVKLIVVCIVKVFGGCGVFGVELMINGDEVYFVDVIVCFVGSVWVIVCSQWFLVFELQVWVILGLVVDILMILLGVVWVINLDYMVGWVVVGVVLFVDVLIGVFGVLESDVVIFGCGFRVVLVIVFEVVIVCECVCEVVFWLNVLDLCE